MPRVLGVQQVGDRWGVIMSRAEGPCFVDAMRGHPERLPGHLEEMARLQFRVHSHPGTRLGSLKVRLAGDISRATILGRGAAKRSVGAAAAMPDGERLCHGDFHPLNILGPIGRKSWSIGWTRLGAIRRPTFVVRLC